MIDLSSVLSELLYDRDAVIVPGLGMFVRHRDSAKVNVITNHFERPSSILHFDPRQREENDLLAKAYEACQGCSSEAAREAVSRFVSDCYEAFKQGRSVAIPGIGTLFMDDGETLRFEQEQGVNFNGDAFGLGDFNAASVHDAGNENDWRAQVMRQNKEKNTPMTVDRRALREGENDEHAFRRRRKRAVAFSILSFLLLIVAALGLLHFLEVIHLDHFIPRKPVLSAVIPVHRPADTILNPLWVRYYPAPVLSADTVQLEESLPSQDTVSSPEPDQSLIKTEMETEPQPEFREPQPSETEKALRYRIIGGCFSQQENADNLVVLLHEQGYANAEVMLRGKQYYVCYGRFATLEEAKAELAKIRGTSNNKAWILDK